MRLKTRPFSSVIRWLWPAVFVFPAAVFSAAAVTGADFKTGAKIHVDKLASLGIREAGSPAEAEAADYIGRVLETAGWRVSHEPFDFLAFDLERSRLRLAGLEVIPERVVIDPYGGEGRWIGAYAVVPPEMPRQELQALDLKGRIVITARPANMFQLSLLHPRAVVFVSSENYVRLSEARADSIELEVQGEVRALSSSNVTASFPVEAPIGGDILISAHYDSIGGPGACDNASGVGVLLELARHFAERGEDLPCRLRVVAFGAEELGMIGSRAFIRRHAEDLSRCRLLFNLDTIGGGGEIFIETRGGRRGASAQTGRSQVPPSLDDKAWNGLHQRWTMMPTALVAAYAASCVPEWLPDIVAASCRELGIPFTAAAGAGSDHRMFAQAGIPATNIAVAGCRTHGPDDTPERIDGDSLQKTGEIVAGVIEKAMAVTLKELRRNPPPKAERPSCPVRTRHK
jgi:Iap family predicted aminopeptidase